MVCYLADTKEEKEVRFIVHLGLDPVNRSQFHVRHTLLSHKLVKLGKHNAVHIEVRHHCSQNHLQQSTGLFMPSQ